MVLSWHFNKLNIVQYLILSFIPTNIVTITSIYVLLQPIGNVGYTSKNLMIYNLWHCFLNNLWAIIDKIEMPSYTPYYIIPIQQLIEMFNFPKKYLLIICVILV